MRELLEHGDDEDRRFEGFVLLAQLATDIHLLRRVLVKTDG